jgi:hypothetical protein
MQAKVLNVPPVVTDQERADEWADQLEDLLLEVGRIFPRADLRCRAAACVRGLLGPLSRKNGWQIAEHAGDSRPDGQQHLLNRACWDVDELRDVVRRYVVEGLDDDGAGLAPGGAGVLVIDETGFAKKGRECYAQSLVADDSGWLLLLLSPLLSAVGSVPRFCGLPADDSVTSWSPPHLPACPRPLPRTR